MLLVYAQNHADGTYCKLNICTKCIVLSPDVIWLNKTYGEYVSRKENTKVDTYILKDEYESYNWYHILIDPLKNEVKTEK